MLPENLIPARLDGARLMPSFLETRDHDWVRALVDEIDGFSGRTVRELEARLQEPLPGEPPHLKARAATRLLTHLWRGFVEAPVPPPIARETVFVESAARPAEPAQVLAVAAAKLGVSMDVIRECLFADLPGERIVRRPEHRPTAQEVLLRTNQLIARSLLARASVVHLCVEGAIAPVVHAAKEGGLLCTVEEERPQVLHISGPFALFRRTLLYARALGDLLDALAWCGGFELHADCFLRGERGELRLSSLDPIFPGAPPRPAERKLQARFAKELARTAPEWTLVRDPAPIACGGVLLFADFALRHGEAQLLVEILGFWTPEFVDKKLRRAPPNAILCVDEDRRCGDGDLPSHRRLVRFRRRIPVDAVIAASRAPPSCA